MKLRDKVCLITGATGIAAAASRLAASEGARVFTAGLAESDCRALAGQTGGAWDAADLTVPESAPRAVARCLEAFGRIDALFNVAGGSGRRFGDGPAHECTDQGWSATLDLNLTTMFRMCRAVLGYMLAARIEGAILNMGSVTAFSPEPRFFATHAYAAAKGAVESLSKAMAAYYAPHGIRVNVLAPGLVRTPMSARAQNDAAIVQYMERKQPLAHGILEPEEIARAAVFLMSDEARSITGQVLAVDAGWAVSGT